MKISMGTEVKNAPKASNEIPPKVNSTPPIMVRMAIIVTPIGRLICSVKSNNDLIYKNLNKKNLENLELFLLIRRQHTVRQLNKIVIPKLFIGTDLKIISLISYSPVL